MLAERAKIDPQDFIKNEANQEECKNIIEEKDLEIAQILSQKERERKELEEIHSKELA